MFKDTPTMSRKTKKIILVSVVAYILASLVFALTFFSMGLLVAKSLLLGFVFAAIFPFVILLAHSVEKIGRWIDE